MARPKIKLDDKGMQEVLHSDGVVEALYNEAEPMLEEAIRRAPVDTGTYKGSFKLIEHRGRKRTSVRVANVDPKAMLIESRLGVLGKSRKGKSLQLGREKARVRRAERKYEKSIAAEESGDGF